MKKIARFAGLVLALGLAGCSSTPEKRYPLHSEVISVEAPRGLIVIEHREIPGLMPAMTMQCSVADPKQIENLQPGDKLGQGKTIYPRDYRGTRGAESKCPCCGTQPPAYVAVRANGSSRGDRFPTTPIANSKIVLARVWAATPLPLLQVQPLLCCVADSVSIRLEQIFRIRRWSSP
jgi:Copper binding periplasmic protein CusF